VGTVYRGIGHSLVDFGRATGDNPAPPYPAEVPPVSQTRLKVQLSVFMFLQYFIWGSWYVSMAVYLLTTLRFEGAQVGAAYGAFAIGSMISPFFVGLVADRYFASEKLLGVLGLLGGAILIALPSVTEFTAFFPLLILYCATYAPTLALGNSLSLHHLRDARRDFPQVKVFSAVGWIAGGVTLALVSSDESANQFYLAGGLSVLFGLFSFTLPHTPPRKVGANVSVGEVLGLDALGLLRKPAFAAFILCMFLICIPLYFYFVNVGPYLQELGWTYRTAKLSLAQVSDVIFLVLLPFMLRGLGYKLTITIGILAWLARYLFLWQSAGMDGAVQALLIYSAILLHGVCYDFLFIAGQLYVDNESTERNRGAAQGFIAFILWGVGAFVGTNIAGRVQGAHTIDPPTGSIAHDWAGIWLIPAYMAAGVLIIFLVFFREPRTKGVPTTTEDEGARDTGVV
jgi:nucleoside transporter